MSHEMTGSITRLIIAYDSYWINWNNSETSLDTISDADNEHVKYLFPSL